MQDNVPCHIAKRVLELFSEQNIQVLKWPAQRPDLNPIENLWKIFGDKVTQKHQLL